MWKKNLKRVKGGDSKGERVGEKKNRKVGTFIPGFVESVLQKEVSKNIFQMCLLYWIKWFWYYLVVSSFFLSGVSKYQRVSAEIQ